MKYVLEVLRILIISLEMVVVLLLIVTSYYYPSLFILIGNKVKLDQEIWKFVPIIPVGILTWAVAQYKDLLFPSGNSSNRALLDWPDYWRLKYRVIISMLILLACIFISLVAWLFKGELSPKTIGCMFCISVLVAIVTAGSLLLAIINIRQITEK